MKTIRVFGAQTNANIAAGYLNSLGIETEVRGSREYASIVLGGDSGRYELLVADECVDTATEELANLEKAQLNTAEPTTPRAPRSKQYSLRLSIFCAFLSWFILPIAFTLASLGWLYDYIWLETSFKKRVLASIVILPLNTLGILHAIELIKYFFVKL